jgi:hypothetical protein
VSLILQNLHVVDLHVVDLHVVDLHVVDLHVGKQIKNIYEKLASENSLIPFPVVRTH